MGCGLARIGRARVGMRPIVATETEWDAGATLWDVDVQGPGTRTIWDLVPDVLKIDQLARVLPSRWLATCLPSGWLVKVKRR